MICVRQSFRRRDADGPACRLDWRDGEEQAGVDAEEVLADTMVL
jgi:hypothetical protein